MNDNVCCPLLKIIKCGDTKKHKHLYCDPQHTIEQTVISNDWVKVFCIGEFTHCKYFPKEG